MKHLNENDFLDLLFNEEQSEDHLRHIRQCKSCQDQLELLEDGLEVAKLGDPGEISMDSRPVNLGLHPWKRISYRVAFGVAAVFLLFSVLGFRAEVRDGDFSIQFSLFNGSSATAVSREELTDLEDRLVEALNLQSKMTSTEMNQHFELLQAYQYRDLMELSIQVKESLVSSELQTGKKLASLNRDLEQLKFGTQPGEGQ